MSNNYDDFATARALEFAQKQNFTHAYIEKPAMYALLPNLEGKMVLCIGCGTGEECLELKARGADVTGFDNSRASIEYAKQHIEGITFEAADMDDPATYAAFSPDQFDLVYSSLTFHYSNDMEQLLQNITRILKPGGQLLFSVGHPLRWATDVTKDAEGTTVLMGYHKGPAGIKVWGNYLQPQRFSQQLSDGPKVAYWMRPISSYFNLLAASRLVIQKFEEPAPLEKAERVDRDLFALRSKLPVDMIFLAKKYDLNS